jgi:hypothetical protein
MQRQRYSSYFGLHQAQRAEGNNDGAEDNCTILLRLFGWTENPLDAVQFPLTVCFCRLVFAFSLIFSILDVRNVASVLLET